MDDLVQFLHTQLDEDERAARRAGDSFRQIGETGVIVATEGDRAEECASANWAGIAEHIVRHDPARVLREVEVKRQVIREREDARATAEADPSDVSARVALLAFGIALRALASVYADHPDYREEWAP
jgi:hypothetical protein